MHKSIGPNWLDPLTYRLVSQENARRIRCNAVVATNTKDSWVGIPSDIIEFLMTAKERGRGEREKEKHLFQS